MADAARTSFDEGTGIDWPRVVLAGVAATVAITISLGLFGTNLVRMLGSSMAPNSGAGAQYLIGGMAHLMVGLIFAVSYAALFANVRPWGTALKALVFGTAITAVALVGMPVMMAMMGGGGGAANPCNPCASKPSPVQQAPQAANPCAPANPCNPCAAKGAANPCAAGQQPANPCAAKGAANPCAAGQQPANACAAAKNPCNPCGGGGAGSPFAGLISLINHLIYAGVLATLYGRARATA